MINGDMLFQKNEAVRNEVEDDFLLKKMGMDTMSKIRHFI